MACTLVLIDTSVWVEALSAGGNPACHERVRDLVSAQLAATCEIVIAEVLRGADDWVQAASLDARLRSVEVLPLEGVGTLAAAMGREMEAPRRNFGDLLIAATARIHQVALLHRDDDLSRIAARFGVEDETP